MKVAVVMTASAGGIGRHVASLLPRLASRGHQVTVFCPPSTAEIHGMPATAAGAGVRPLRDLLAARAADVVHAHGYKAGLLAIAVCRGGPPVVVTWHNAILASTAGASAAQRVRALGGRLLQRLVARGADLTLGASSDLVAEALRLGAPQARLAPVAAPVLPPPSGDRDALRRDLGLGDDDIAVLTVGRLAVQKNLDLLLDAAALVDGRAPLRFLLVGAGPERPRLVDRIRTQHLPVELLGARTDIPELMHAADIALLTSTWEARALVAQEALLAGLPLVSTRVGGIEELVGDAAMLVPAGDGSAVADALLALAGEPGRRLALAERGRERARSWPGEDAVADEVAAGYRDLVSRGVGQRRGRVTARRRR
jgi:glycosyltransferase involved in cell wall biosynthesis